MKTSNKPLVLTLALSSLLSANAVAQISIPTVFVGNPGNANDSTGFGGVSDNYKIGTYEVTISQYTTFLNAVAATDTYSLYNSSMASDLNVAGILQIGLPGSHSYTASGNGSRPVTYVSWFDSARFVNWLENGQPTGGQIAGVTETGTYTLNGAVSGVGIARNGSISFWLPSENEWYKAAYHQPAAQGGDADSYWLYPTSLNSVPNSRNGSLSDANSANFFRDDSIANGFNGGYAVNNSLSAPVGNALTEAGAFALADSYYGTFDQGGNVSEWTEGINAGSRITRGGSWSSTETVLRATARPGAFPTTDSPNIGFRIAMVPEPGVVSLMALGLAFILARRKQTR